MSLACRANLTLLLLLLAVSTFTAKSADREAPDRDPVDQAWALLRDGLNSRHVSDRTVAVQALSLLPGNRSATAFALRALHDKDARVRAAAAVVLGQQHARTAIPELRKALDDPEIPVVMAAAHSLLLLKDRSAYDVYYAILMGDRKSSEGLIQSQLDRLKDPKQLADIGIAEGVGFIPFGGMGYDAYRQFRRHDHFPVRAMAARYLAEDPDPMSEDALMQTALADSDEEVRLAALDALTQRGDGHCIERLQRNLSDDKPAVRYRTAAVIIHLNTVSRKHSRR